MKMLKSCCAAIILLTSVTASGQIDAENVPTGKDATIAKMYGHIDVSYSPITAEFGWGDFEDVNLTGISLGFIRGYSVSRHYPIYIETGARLTYAFDEEETCEDDLWFEPVDNVGLVAFTSSASLKEKITYINITVPINVAYRFVIPNSNVVITPFTGPTVKWNVMCKYKRETEETVAAPDYGLSASVSKSKEYNVFDKDEVGDYQWKRFQIGWNVGAGISYKALYVGINYGCDITHAAKKTETDNWTFSIGYAF